MPDLGLFRVPACTCCCGAQGLQPPQAFWECFTSNEDNEQSLLLARALPPTLVIVHPYITFQTEDWDIYSNPKVPLISCLFPLSKFEL